MANEISKIKLPGSTTEYTVKDNSAITDITRSGTTFTATKRDGTTFEFTQKDDNTTYTFATGDNNGQIKITPSGGTAQNVSVKGLGAAAYKGTTTSVTSGSSDLVTSGAVYTAIDNLPEPMIFKGSLGTGGTITTLPTASSANEGFTYKVITAGTYASQAAKVGDLFISNGTDWIWIPSGDEPSGTVTSVAIANGGGLSVSGSPITSSGTITISHADTSSQASVDNSGRTYIQDIELDTYGHVTKITSATETVVNTDRYVNSAAFANDTSGVKMTLTRAGSDTATVTGTIPLVSSSTAGVAPKGTAVSSQSQSTKFLREDGSWAAPSYTTNTNTTYTLSVGTGDDANKIVLTPSSGTANKITVPYATKVGVNSIDTAPSETTAYDIILKRSTDDTLSYFLRGFRYVYSITGDTYNSANLYIGYTNSVPYSTGSITLGTDGGGYHTIEGTTTQLSSVHTLPSSGGTILNTGTTSFTQSLSSGTKIGTIKINNVSTDLYCQTNTNTTYTLSADTSNNKITLTPSSGSAQSITVPYATSAGSATALWTANIGGSGTTTHASTLKSYFDSNKTTIPRNKTLSYYSSAYNNGSQYMGYFLNGYDTAPYGGFFVAHYNKAYYIGISNGTYTQNELGRFTATPTSGQVVITDGTEGGIKSSGYTIAKSVPSDAVFTDHYAWSDITGKPSSFTPASHTHGNIQNGGTLQTNDITIASGDKLVVTDSSDSAKVARTSISFDGSTTTKCLTQKGTWETFGTSNLAIGTTATTALAGNTKYAGASTAGGSATSAAKLDTATAGSATQPCYFANGVPSACTYSLAKSVPSNAVFTDTNNAVTQTATTTSANYELLFSATADNTTRTEGARKTDSLKYNPSTKELTLDGTVVLNGYSRSTSTDPCPSIVLKANNIDTDTAVSARTYSNSEINVHDKDGDRLGFMNWFKDTDGSIGFALSAQNKSAGGGNYYNTLEMRVDKTGNRAYSISDAKAFRTAINTTTCSFTKSISSLAGATIVRRGNVVTLEFGHKISNAGSYTDIGTVSPAPIETLHFVVNIGGSWNLARINTSGVVSFNNAVSVTANAYLIGSCTYITAD